LKKVLVFLCIFSFLSIITSEEYLLTVKDLAEKEDYFIIEQVVGNYIVIANDEELGELQKRSSSLKILDKNPREHQYYLVFPVAETRESIAKAGTILEEFVDVTEQKEFQRSFLVRVPEGNEDVLFDLRAEKNFLQYDKMVFPTEPPPGFRPYNPETFTYNQLIQDMVDAVNQDTLRYMVTYMQDIRSRHASYNFNKDEMVPWFCDLLREYGCDSVFEQDINSSNYDAPNPVGIRVGEKYPSYTRYYIVGGHPDAMPRQDINYGADDNATGASMVLEAARVMQNYNFEYTIVYMGFNAEEVGLLGSKRWAEVADARGDTILGTISYDMAGHTGSRERFRIRYYTELPGCEEYAYLFENASDMYTQLDLYVASLSSINGWSDHASFWRKGFLALYGMEGEMSSNVYHTLGDTVDCPDGLNNFPFFRRTVQASIAATAIKECAAVMEQVGGIVKEPKSDKNRGQSIIPGTGNIIRISFTVNNSRQPVTLHIYNSSGKIINSIEAGLFPKGTHSINWNCKSYNGKSVAKGLYIIEYGNGNGKSIEKVMVTN
jgi:hypothetical protein